MVGFAAPFIPAEAGRHGELNHKIFYGDQQSRQQSRRWRRSTDARRDDNNPTNAADFGDGLLMRLGYTYR